MGNMESNWKMEYIFFENRSSSGHHPGYFYNFTSFLFRRCSFPSSADKEIYFYIVALPKKKIPPKKKLGA